MILTISPASRPTLRDEELTLWLPLLCEELGCNLTIASGSTPPSPVARPVRVNDEPVAWIELGAEHRPEVAEALGQTLERFADARTTIQDLARALAGAWKEINFRYELMTVFQVVDPGAACALIVRQLARTSQAQHVSLYMMHGGELVLRASYPVPPPAEADVAAEALAAWQAHEPSVTHGADGCQVCLPIVDDAQLVGALWLQGPEPLGQSLSTRFLAGVATQIGQAIRLQQLIAEEIKAAELRKSLEFAGEFQRGLMPKRAPCLAGARLAGACQASHIMAGDAFDYMPHAGGVDLLVADVSGHGPAAAILMASLLGMLHSLDTGALSLPEVARRANRLIVREVDQSGQYVTALFARLAPGARRLSYVSLGHATPLLLRAGSVVSLPRVLGLPAGFVDETDYGEHSIDLQAGDCLVLYTDGLPEARGQDGRFFGVEGLTAALVAKAGEPAETILAHLFATCQAATGVAEIADDQTAIVIEVQ